MVRRWGETATLIHGDVKANKRLIAWIVEILESKQENIRSDLESGHDVDTTWFLPLSLSNAEFVQQCCARDVVSQPPKDRKKAEQWVHTAYNLIRIANEQITDVNDRFVVSPLVHYLTSAERRQSVNAEDIRSIYQSLFQSRKNRAGTIFELVLGQQLRALGIGLVKQAKPESGLCYTVQEKYNQNKQHDVIVYRDGTAIFLLTLKTSMKDRQGEIAPECTAFYKRFRMYNDNKMADPRVFAVTMLQGEDGKITKETIKSLNDAGAGVACVLGTETKRPKGTIGLEVLLDFITSAN